MQPWKMFVRSVSVVTVLTAGGFAAGQGVLPFSNASRLTAPQTAVGDDSATDPGTAAPSVDPAASDGTDDSTTTTTTEAPKPDVPSADPVDDPAPTKPPVADVPDPATPPAASDSDGNTPPAVTVVDDAPAVCAAAVATPCGPADPAPAAAAPTSDELVQACVNWWNALADRLAANGRAQWADRAHKIADHCDEFVARWEKRLAARPAVKPDHPKKDKGDHNCDGHDDNGWRKHTPSNKTYPDCDAAGQTPAPQGNGRPATAPGHVKHGR